EITVPEYIYDQPAEICAGLLDLLDVLYGDGPTLRRWLGPQDLMLVGVARCWSGWHARAFGSRFIWSKTTTATRDSPSGPYAHLRGRTVRRSRDTAMSEAAQRTEMARAFNEPITVETAGQFQPAERPDNVKVALTTRFPREVLERIAAEAERRGTTP